MDFIAFYLKKLLLSGVVMGIRNKDGLFIGIPKMNLDPCGNLFYIDNKKRRKKVSSLVFEQHGDFQDKYWFDSLYFIDKNANIISFKSYLEKEIKSK